MVLKIAVENVENLRKYLENKGFTFEERPYQFFLARKTGVVVNVYNSGKIVIGGNKKEEIQEIEEFVMSIGGEEEIKEEKTELNFKGTRIGTDEVGKGDYFGYLVIAGVLIDEKIEEELRRMKVKDSKLLSDTTIRDLAHEIRKFLGEKRYEIVAISPLTYNILHKKLGSVNRILGWAHARVIENLLSNGIECNLAIADQFGDPGFIKNALMEKGKQIKLIQTPKAERDIAVATASILARDKFLWKMEDLKEEYKFDFPRGAGKKVDEKGKEFVKLYGPEVLKNVAKIHFSNTLRIVGREIEITNEEIEMEKIHLSKHSKSEEENLNLECYNLVTSFECELRKFIESKLKEFYGEKWWEEGIPEVVRKRAEKNIKEEEKEKKVSPIEGLLFSNYEAVICDSKNWKIFSDFLGDKDVFKGHLRTVNEIRNYVAHSRKVSKEDMIKVLGSIAYLREKITGQRTLDSFGVSS